MVEKSRGASAVENIERDDEDWRQSNYGRLVLNSFRHFESFLLRGLQSAGYDNIRIVHLTVMRFVDDDGTRISDIAAGAGFTKQAASQFVAECVRMGLLDVYASKSDRRAKAVKFTDYGREILAASHEIVAQFENIVVETVGARKFESVKKTLAAINTGFETKA